MESHLQGGCQYGRTSKKLKINNKKCFQCAWTSRSVKELVAEKPLERFIDKLEGVAPIIKAILCQSELTKEGEGATLEIHMHFSK